MKRRAGTEDLAGIPVGTITKQEWEEARSTVEPVHVVQPLQRTGGLFDG